MGSIVEGAAWRDACAAGVDEDGGESGIGQPADQRVASRPWSGSRCGSRLSTLINMSAF